MQQNVFAKANQPPPLAADIRRVKLFEEERKNGPELDSVQMDWPLPFSSPWNAAAIHVLAEGFWLLHRDKAFNESELTVDQIKVLCISKLERTRKEFNDLRSSDRMDTEEGAAEEHTIRKCQKAAGNRRHTRKIGVSFC
jgi:hypothetical protein